MPNQPKEFTVAVVEVTKCCDTQGLVSELS